MATDRRTFLKRGGAVISAALVAGRERLAGDPHAAECVSSAAGPSPMPLDGAMLRAVADAVLPESLGQAGRESAVRQFEFWWAEFEPTAELVHPYGGWIIPYGPPDREPEWAAQLAELEGGALETFGMSFGEISLVDRRGLIAGAVIEGGPGFPRPARAQHVAVALMAHYFGSADASNRCYGVMIDKLTCRTTATAGEVPPPVSER